VATETMKILQLVPEQLPTHRPDVTTLFGRSLPAHGVICDIVAKAAGGEIAGFVWPGQVWFAPAAGSRVKRSFVSGLC
jgi:hypothetical protein